MGSSSEKNERAEKRSNLSHVDVSNRETASNEATAAMPELIKDRKQLVQFLKDGGRSGISLDFGKPTIDENSKQTAARTDKAAESGRAKDSESKSAWTSLTMDRQSLIELLKTGGKSSITGDFGKPLILDSSRPGDQRPADGIAAEHAKAALEVNSKAKIKTGADGRVEAVYEDRSAYSRIPTKDGGYVERHSGARPDDTFVITKTADGRLLIAEREGEKPYKPIDDPAIKTERDRLSTLARKHITDPEDYARFQANMARFEAREHDLEESLKKQHPKLSAEEITKQAHDELRKAYANISRLLEAKDNPHVKLDSSKRVEIAEQVMRNAANPTLIDQGFHNTCNVATVEVRSYARHPADATQLVVDMATKGEYITRSGTHVTINEDAFKNHETDPYGKYNPPLPPGRGLASQIFEVTAVNIHYAKNNPSIHYEQVAADPTATPPHNGEQLIDYSGAKPKPVLGADKLPIRSPALNGEQIADVSSEITGDQPKAAYIKWDKNPGNKVETISDEASFIKVLAEAKAKGELPVTIEVHTGNEPFLSDSGSGAAGGSGGWHVVNVTDFRPGPPPAVSVDNQWGPAADHTSNNQLSVQDLYLTMREPNDPGQITEQLADLQKELDADKAAGKAASKSDFLKEIELNMLKYKTGKESLEDCEKQIKQALTSAEKAWKAGNLSSKDYEAAIFCFERTVQTFPVEDRFKLLRFEVDSNLISKEGYEEMLVRAMVKARKDQQKSMRDGTFTEQQQDQYLKAIQDFHNNLRQLPAADQAAVKKAIAEMLKA